MYKDLVSNNSLLLVTKSTMKLKRSSVKYCFITSFKVNNKSTRKFSEVILY